jgi:hypothetical protein
MRWINSHFKHTYLTYLEDRWGTTVSQALTNAPRFATLSSSASLSRSVLPAFLEDALWRQSAPLIAVLLVMTLVLVVVARFGTVGFRLMRLVGLLLAAMVIGSVLIWITTDPAMDMGRQFLPVAILGRLAVIIGLATSADALLSSPRRTRRTTNPEPQSSPCLVAG